MTINKINEQLYLGTHWKVWRDGDMWRFKTFGKGVRAADGQATHLNLALGAARRIAEG